MRPLEMTHDRAMRAVETIRDALMSIERGALSDAALVMIVQNAVWPMEPDEADIEAARADMREIMGSDEWQRHHAKRD